MHSQIQSFLPYLSFFQKFLDFLVTKWRVVRYNIGEAYEIDEKFFIYLHQQP